MSDQTDESAMQAEITDMDRMEVVEPEGEAQADPEADMTAVHAEVLVDHVIEEPVTALVPENEETPALVAESSISEMAVEAPAEEEVPSALQADLPSAEQTDVAPAVQEMPAGLADALAVLAEMTAEVVVEKPTTVATTRNPQGGATVLPAKSLAWPPAIMPPPTKRKLDMSSTAPAAHKLPAMPPQSVLELRQQAALDYIESEAAKSLEYILRLEAIGRGKASYNKDTAAKVLLAERKLALDSRAPVMDAPSVPLTAEDQSRIKAAAKELSASGFGQPILHGAPGGAAIKTVQKPPPAKPATNQPTALDVKVAVEAALRSSAVATAAQGLMAMIASKPDAANLEAGDLLDMGASEENPFVTDPFIRAEEFKVAKATNRAKQGKAKKAIGDYTMADMDTQKKATSRQQAVAKHDKQWEIDHPEAQWTRDSLARAAKKAELAAEAKAAQVLEDSRRRAAGIAAYNQARSAAAKTKEVVDITSDEEEFVILSKAERDLLPLPDYKIYLASYKEWKQTVQDRKDAEEQKAKAQQANKKQKLAEAAARAACDKEFDEMDEDDLPRSRGRSTARGKGRS